MPPLSDQAKSARMPSQETMLLDLIQRLRKNCAGRLAVHIHLSKLSRAYGRERYAQIALESFSTFVSGFEGQLFPFSNGDMVFVSKNTPPAQLEKVIERIEQLFSLDPLLQQYEPGGQSAFCTWYDLEHDYDMLLAEVQTLHAEAEHRQEQAAANTTPPEKETVPIQPALLSKLEYALETADVTNLAHRQMVCTLIDDAPPQPLFEEIFVSIGDLQRIVTPGVDLSANVWLFRYLTQTLDKRIIRMLLHDGSSIEKPFSLNLNVATILSPDFAKFETVITPQLRGKLVIEMNKLDVFADMGAFLFARDYLRDHGFRLCLDGLTHHTLPYYDRSHLGFDLIKLYWAPGAVEDILPSMIPDVRNIIRETGQAHTILCRCDSPRAIDLGQELGIVMFQGYEVDKRLEASRLRIPLRV